MPNSLEYARECYHRGAWSVAHEAFRLADIAGSLDQEDLHRFGVSAYLIGREPEFERCFDRLHRAQLKKGERQGAARSAFWIGLSLTLRGEIAQSNAWTARCKRLVEGLDCVEQGYAVLAPAGRQLREGHADLAHEAASTAVRIGARFGDADLIAMARHVQARALIEQDQVPVGLDLLDETMLLAVAGELFPILTGLLYCSVIEMCQKVYAMSRAREWTLAFSRWCGRQSEALAFSGRCLVDRAEIQLFHGAWPEALADASRACERAAEANRKPPAAALYQQGEIHRLRGDHREAEEAYLAASQRGYDPQPGLALLRLAQGQIDAACAAMRRTLRATDDRLQRARLLPGCVEVLLAAGEIEEASSACRELHELSNVFDADVLRAAAAQTAGAIQLAERKEAAALGPLRHAFELWTHLDAPYEAARVRAQIALACRALGDEDTAGMEFAAARSTFRELTARADLTRVDALEGRRTSGHDARLSPRETEVLRLVAAGHTNKVIAARLGVSERTVDRHVSNILTKLDVSSRTAATASAYELELL